MTKDSLNGSTDLLAKAMRRVFKEEVQEGVQPVKDAVEGLEQDVDTKADGEDARSTRAGS